MNKSATHNGLTCLFNDKNHTYTIEETGQRLTSVTAVIKRYTPPFDAPAMAQRMVDNKNKNYIGMTVDEIQFQWKEKAELASSEGTSLHDYCENWPKTQGWGFHPKTHRVFEMTKQVNKMFPKLLERFRIVAAESIVFSPKMGVAGQVDLILADDKTKEGIILDWKTNSKITDESSAFGNMLVPIEHLKNADVVKYGLQLGLYEKILIDENFYPEFKGYRKSLIHIQESFGKVVKVKNYQDEIERILYEHSNKK